MKRNYWYLLIFLLVPALAGLVAAPTPAEAASPLVSTAWLQKHLKTPGVVIIDVRTESNYNFSHLPGAVSLPYLTKWEPVNQEKMCRLMATPEEFTKEMRKLGVNNSSHVIIYDQGNTAGDATEGGASMWIMQTMGHNNVSYLDGGFTKWTFEGRRIVGQKYGMKGVTAPKPGNFTARLDQSKLATTQDVVQDLKARRWLLLDNRNAFQYFGTTKEAAASRYGHIPGAISLPAAFLVNAGTNKAPATLRSKRELEAMVRGVGIPANRDTEIITYCNSAQQSGMGFFVLHDLLGYRHVKCYDGSILQYSAERSLPMVLYTWSNVAR